MICRGSYGEIRGASRAVTSKARTMTPPTAPSGFRLANLATAITGAHERAPFHTNRGMALPAASPRSTVSFFFGVIGYW